MFVPRTPAGVVTPSFDDSNYICRPEYLDQDEVLYELRIRNQSIPIQTRHRTAVLSRLFHEEKTNAVALTNCTIPGAMELRTCMQKADNLAQMIEKNKITEGFDTVFMSKFIHLKNRIERIDHQNDPHVSQTIFEIHEKIAEIRQLFDTKWHDYVNRYRRNLVNDNSIHNPINEIGSLSTKPGTTEHLVNENVVSAANIAQNNFGNHSIPTTGSSNQRSTANVPTGVAGQHMPSTTSSVGPNVVKTTNTFNAPISSHAVHFPNLHIENMEQYGDQMTGLRTPSAGGKFSGITSTQNRNVHNANPPPQFNQYANNLGFDIYLDSNRTSFDNGARRSLLSDDDVLLNQLINNNNLVRTPGSAINNETLDEDSVIINGKKYVLENSNPHLPNQTYNINNQFASNDENNTQYNKQTFQNAYNTNVNDQTFVQNQFRNLRDSNSLHRLNLNNNNRPNNSQPFNITRNTHNNEIHNYPAGTYGPNYDNANPNKPCHVPIFKWNLKFTGQPDKNGDRISSFVSFIQEVDFRRESSQISDRELFANIILLLDGPAKTWFMTHRNQFNNWQELRRAMENKFMGGATQHTFFMQLASRKQRVDESVSEYFADMLLKFSSVPDLQEGRKISMIIGGLLPKFRNRSLGVEWDSLNRLEDFLCDIEVGFNMDINPSEPFKRFNRPQMIKPVHSVDINEYDEMNTHENDSLELNNENGTNHLSIHAAQFVPQNNMKTNTSTPFNKSQNIKPNSKDNEMIMLNKSCYNCGESGHLFRSCDRQRKSIYCRKCGMKNILVHTCKCPKEENEKNCSALACVNDVILVSEEESQLNQN